MDDDERELGEEDDSCKPFWDAEVGGCLGVTWVHTPLSPAFYLSTMSNTALPDSSTSKAPEWGRGTLYSLIHCYPCSFPLFPSADMWRDRLVSMTPLTSRHFPRIRSISMQLLTGGYLGNLYRPKLGKKGAGKTEGEGPL